MKERIITAICLLVVVLPLIYFGSYWFIGLIVVAASIAAWEMIAMHAKAEADQDKKVLFEAKIITLLGTFLMVFMPNITHALLLGAFSAMVLLILSTCIKNQGDIKFHLLIIPYIGLSFRALIEVRSHSLTLFFFLIATVILTDSAAYFTGRLFGKHKLAPTISPKKTVEGAIGGWLIGCGFAIFFGLSQYLFAERWMLIVLAVGLPIVSQIGDLIASAFKRKYGIKDYGKLFPGHGGVMDRVDSQLLAAVLIYVIIQIGGVLS